MNKRSLTVLVIALVIIVLAVIVWLSLKKSKSSLDQSDVTIVLSPHFDDAALSLGGLLARKDRTQMVATFFTGIPAKSETTKWDTESGFNDSTKAQDARISENAVAMSLLGATVKNYGYLDNQYSHGESDSAMESDIANDIQVLIASFGSRSVYVYGPSTFGTNITHPDHALLHKAFVDVATAYPKSNVHFFFYEDYPYVESFNRSYTKSLEKFLEDDTGLLLNRVDIPLTAGEVSKKISSIDSYASQVESFNKQNIDILKNDQAYTASRCGMEVACEAVYQVMQ